MTLKNNEKSLVSIIINCFNGEKYLKEAINSVYNQSYKNWEIIFWDNLSIDRSKNIVNSFSDKRIKYFYSNNFLQIHLISKYYLLVLKLYL